MEDIEFRDFCITLEANDRLFVYTDGVNEAFSKKGEQFGEERICKVLESLKESDLKDMLHSVKKEIDEFCKGEPQSDDITMMLLEIKA
jgi:sigma-B regulation protein RsbU (phosphoserine phosphatase)